MDQIVAGDAEAGVAARRQVHMPSQLVSTDEAVLTYHERPAIEVVTKANRKADLAVGINGPMQVLSGNSDGLGESTMAGPSAP